jgi:nitronate monooxygenase
MLTFTRGMKLLEKAAFSATYKSVWCAGPSIEFVDKQQKIADIFQGLLAEYQETIKIWEKINHENS